MKILVFGKTGQVATELARFPNVTLLGRDHVDLSTGNGISEAISASNADVVINAAAYTAVDKAETEPDIAKMVNSVAPGKMAASCAATGKHFLHISTDYVFDGSGNAAWLETDTTGPLGVYGQTKLDGEKAVAAAGGRYAILRTSWVFSAHGSNFVKTMLRLGAERDALSIVGDQFGGPTSARAIAAALMKIANSNFDGGGENGVYHFSGLPNTSWSDFARTIFFMAGQTVDVTDIPSSEYPTPAQRPTNSRLDCSKIARIYGINRPDWRNDLREVLTELEASA